MLHVTGAEWFPHWKILQISELISFSFPVFHRREDQFERDRSLCTIWGLRLGQLCGILGNLTSTTCLKKKMHDSQLTPV